MLLIPIFVVFLLVDFSFGDISIGEQVLPIEHIIATAIFIVASATDWLDGYYARKYQLVTNLGKFLDPLADKLLITAALVSLVELGLFPAWVVILIISREFAVTGLRLVAATDGEVIAASSLGKWKTVTQIVAAIAVMLHNIPFQFLGVPFAEMMIYVAAFMTVWSGWDYFIKNKHILAKSK